IYIEKMDAQEILPDVTKTLDYLSTANQHIALGSASKNARMILEKVRLIEKFDVLVDGNDVTKAKPDPEVFLIAAQQLDINPENCIVFEDAVAGIQAANTAGMVSIGIGDKNTLHEADYVFKDFTEISEAFLNELINR
ncbi:MAG: HAD-IA family hydrolase, partial [Gelidibacter sp.]